MAKVNRWWTSNIQDARTDMEQYRNEAGACYEQARTAAETSENVREMYELLHDEEPDALQDHSREELIDTYQDRVDDMHATATDAQRYAERIASLAEARTRYVRRIIENHDLADQKPHAFRPEQYGDILDEIERNLETVHHHTEQLSTAIAHIETVQEELGSNA